MGCEPLRSSRELLTLGSPRRGAGDAAGLLLGQKDVGSLDVPVQDLMLDNP